jgi:glutamate 5-kinase
LAIAQGRHEHPLAALDDANAGCTWFVPASEPRTARKRWIASALKAAGAVTLDAGAVAALRRGGSLLPAGVTHVDGTFERGDLLRVLAPDGQEIARGLAAYGSEEAGRIAGRRSAEIEAILGYRGRDELIHRDDLVLG